LHALHPGTLTLAAVACQAQLLLQTPAAAHKPHLQLVSFPITISLCHQQPLTLPSNVQFLFNLNIRANTAQPREQQHFLFVP